MLKTKTIPTQKISHFFKNDYLFSYASFSFKGYNCAYIHTEAQQFIRLCRENQYKCPPGWLRPNFPSYMDIPSYRDIFGPQINYLIYSYLKSFYFQSVVLMFHDLEQDVNLA